MQNIKKMENYIKNNSYKICIVSAVVVIGVICLWNIGLHDRVRRIDDEIGYWGTAAQMAGYDWSDIMKNLAYYSFGYSFVLVPIMLLHRIGISMSICYKIAIVVNVVMLEFAFFLALFVAEKWAPKINKYYRLLCVLAVTLYSNNILHASTAWPEVCVYFLYWCIIALIIVAIEKDSRNAWIGAIVLAIYIFLVHMRTIAVPIALFCIILFYLAKEKTQDKWIISKKIKIIAVSVIAILVICVVWGIIKLVELKSYQMQGTSIGVHNTVSTTFAAVKNLFSIYGLMDLGLGFLGKAFYQGVASFGFSFLGFGVLVKKYILSHKKEKTCDLKDINFFSALFVALSTVGSLAVSAIFMTDNFFRGIPQSTRADRVIYGRYTEFLISVLVLVALLHIGQLLIHLDLMICSVLGMIIATIAVQYQWDTIAFYHPISISNGIDAIAKYSFDEFGNMASYLAYISISIFIVCCLFCINKNKDKVKVNRVIVVLVLMTIFISNGLEGAANLPKIHKKKNVASVVQLLELVPEAEIYCVGEPGVDIKILQWELPERKIHVIERRQVIEINQEEAIIIGNNDYISTEGMGEGVEFLYDSGTIALYANMNTQTGMTISRNIEGARQTIVETENSVSLANAVDESGYLRADGYIYSYRQEGFVTRKTGLSLVDGVYEFEVELEIKNPNSEKIGYILASNEKETQINTVEILKEDIERNGEIKVAVEAPVQNYYEPILGVYTYGQCDIIVKSIQCKQKTSETPRNRWEAGELEEVLRIINSERLHEGNIYYVDCDSSGLEGDPNIAVGEYADYTEEELNIYQMSLDAFEVSGKSDIYIIEKSDRYKGCIAMMEGRQSRFEGEYFILYLED